MQVRKLAEPKGQTELESKSQPLIFNMDKYLMGEQLLPFMDFRSAASFACINKYSKNIFEGNKTYYTAYWRYVIERDEVALIAFVPLNTLKKAVGYSDALVHRWGKIISLQMVYKQAYKKFQNELKLMLINSKTNECQRSIREFKTKNCACGICRGKFSFANCFASSTTTSVGVPFMADENCTAHHIWSAYEARILWGFTDAQIKQIPAWWGLNAHKCFCTADLWEFRLRFPVEDEEDKEEDLFPIFRKGIDADDDVWRRYHDLPGYDKVFFIKQINEQKANSVDLDEKPSESKPKPAYFVLFSPAGNPTKKAPATRDDADLTALPKPKVMRRRSF